LKNILTKTIISFKNNSFSYTGKKIVNYFSYKIRFNPFRKLKAYFHFNNPNLLLGSNVVVSGICKSVKIGKFNNFYSNTIFEFGHDSEFSSGDHVILSYGVLVSCMKSIRIGNYVQIGEFTSIRDTTHNYKGNLTLPMMGSPDISKEIVIGNNVWIGRSCLICEGSIIEDGVVVGAHSVVKGVLEKDGIYAGTPAILIKKRIDGKQN
jgi:acetyltransferase-like isoleucine patch superfamily enzyme